MHDLREKSEALTNTLVPRSPVSPKKLSPLPGHSTYSMKSRDQYKIKNELEQMFKHAKTSNNNTRLSSKIK